MKKGTDKPLSLSANEANDLISQFQAIVDGAHAGILIIDHQFTFIYANRKAVEITGYPENEIIGQDFRSFLVPEDVERLTQYYLENQHGGKPPQSYEIKIKRKDGEYRHLMVNSLVIRSSQGNPQSVVQLLDITDKKKAELHIQHVLRLYNVLSKVNQNILQVKTENKLLKAVSNTLVKEGGFRYCWIGAVNYETKKVDFVCESGKGRNYLKEITIRTDRSKLSRGPTGQAVKKKKPVVFNDLANNPAFKPWRDLALKRKFRSSGAFPVLVHKRVVVVINLYSEEVDFFNEEEIQLLTKTAKDLGFGLEKLAEEKKSKELEQELATSATKMRLIFETFPDAVVVTDPNGRIVESNTAMLNMFGYRKKDEILGRSILDFFSPEDRSGIKKAGWSADKIKKISGKALRMVCRDGKVIETEFSVSPLTNAQGEVTGHVGAIKDVTARVRAELKVKENKEYLEELLKSSPASIYVLEIKGRKLKPTFVSGNLKTLLGYPPEIYLNDPGWWLSKIHPKDLDQALKNQERIFKGETFAHEYRFLKADNEYIWIRDTARVVKDEHNKPVRVIGSWIDITGRKKMEEELRILAMALKSVREYVSITDTENRIIFVNDAFQKAYGYTLEELIGQEISILKDRKELPQTEMILDETLNKGGWEGELLNVRKDGTVFPIHLSTSVIYDQNKQPIALIGVARDLSQMQELEAQLRQSQKMEAIGRLAGGVAHDFNNLLTIILGYCQLSFTKLGPDHPAFANLKQIEGAGKRAADLTRQLLAFSRKQILQPKIIDINQILKNMEKMLRRIIGEDVDLKLILEPDIRYIKADPGQLEQVVMNLCVNARDAMPAGGKLIIETKNVYLDERYVSKHKSSRVGWFVMLAVSDTGTGIQKQHLEHIFEPFFTTKEAGKGTGLGLSTIYGIVKQSDGNIWVYSEPGKGTTFKIYLPVTQTIDSEKEQISSATTNLSGKASILLVEDDQAVRQLTSEGLKEYGYTVYVAAGGAQAMEMAKNKKLKIDLLLTDLVMPSMNGKELAQRIKEMYPNIRTIYMSGYTDNSLIATEIIDKNDLMIQKPFTPQQLAAVIKKALSPDAEKS